MKQKVTLQTIAYRLGISKSTVSRAFNKPELLDKKTVDLVKSEAAKIGYRPNISAKNLALGSSSLFAVLVPDLNYILGDFLTKILYGIELELDKSGASIVISSYGREQSSSLYSKALMRAHISGAVVFAKRLSREQINELKNPPVHTVLVDFYSKKIPCVYVDNFKLGWTMAEYFIQNGHRNFAILPGDDRWENSIKRTKGILSCLEFYGLKISKNSILPCRFEYGFKDALEKFPLFFKSLESSNPPTAVIAGNDEIAAGVIASAAEMGLHIPKDISVMGCDNSFFCDYLSPPLTSVEQNACELGMIAAQMLTGIIPTGQLVCKHKIIIRKSVSKTCR